MTSEDDTRSQRTATLLESGIAAGMERIRTSVNGTAGAAPLLDHLETLDERRAELRRRLDGVRNDGGAWGMASDTSLAGLADILVRVEQLDSLLGTDPDPASLAEAARLAGEPLPHPIRLMGPQFEVIERVRRSGVPPWATGPAVG